MANIFLDANDTFTLPSANTNDTIFGRSGGSETVILQGNPTGTTIDGNVEVVQVAGTAANTTLQVNANGQLELSSGGVVYATFSSGLNQDVNLQFTDGNVTLTQTGAGTFTIENPTNAANNVTINSTTSQAGSAVTLGSDTSTAGGGTGGGGTGGGGTAGTFTLTTNIDSFPGTAGNDTFIGDAATSSLADQVNGAGGTDTLKLFGIAGPADEPTHTGVEIVELTGQTAGGFDVSDNSDVTNLNLINSTSGQTYTLANGQKASVSTMADGEAVDFAGNTVTGLDLAVHGLGTLTGAGVLVDFNSTAQTSVALTASTSASHIRVDDTGGKLKTMTVAGDQAAKIDLDASNTLFTSVDGSAATGALNIILEDDTATANVDVKGGTANDTANFGAALTKDDKFDGGAGTMDALEVTQASVTTVQALSATDKATLNTNLANIEMLKVSDALTSDVDASRFDGVNMFDFNGGLNNGGTSTLSNVSSGVMVTLGDAAGTNTDILAIAINNATLAGNNSDAVTIKLDDSTAGAASDAGVVNLVGVDLLTIDTTQATGGTTTGHVLDIAATSTALDSVTVVGNTALDISGVPLVNSLATVDASGMTLASATSAGLTASIATGGTNGVQITGSGGVDNLTGGDAADVIGGGAGNDNITGGAGNDQLTGGANSDTFIFGATAVANGADTITDFAAGTGNDVLNVGTFTGGTTVAANNLTLTTSSSNVTVADANVYILNIASAISGKDYGGANFAEIFGAGNGQFNTTVATGIDTVVLVKGTDQTQAYFVDEGGDTTLTAGEVSLVGTLTVTGDFAAGNFA